MADERQDLQHHVAVVTGASEGGIGYETAKSLAARGARVVLGCRSEERSLEAMQNERQDLRDRLEFIELDLSSLSATREFADNFKRRHSSLHILVNNAGIAFVPFEKTGDGCEKHFQVNYLSHFLLTLELQSCLEKGARERKGVEAGVEEGGSGEGERKGARVVMVTSSGHSSAIFNPANMNGEQNYSRFIFYYNSKLYMIMSAYCLQRRLKKHGITVSCVHPGKIRTHFVDEPCRKSRILRLISKAILKSPLYKSPEIGAQAVVNCVATPPALSGDMMYYSKMEVKDPSAIARDVRLQKQLWDISVTAVKEHLTEGIDRTFSEVERVTEVAAENAEQTGREGGGRGEEGGQEQEEGEGEGEEEQDVV